VVRLGVVSDEFWEIVAAVIPSREGKQGRPNRDHRLLLEGIAWRYRAGCPWRDLPADFGPWQTVWKRHHRWSLDGTYDAMFAAVMAATGTDVGDGLDTGREVVVGGFDQRAGTPARGRCTLGHPHGGRCRITGKPPTSQLTTQSAGPGAD
jgi:putative transposase